MHIMMSERPEGIILWIDHTIGDDGYPKEVLYIEGQEEAIFRFDVISNERLIGHSPINVDDVFQEFVNGNDFSVVKNSEYVTAIKLYAEEKATGVDKMAKTYRLITYHQEINGLPNYPGQTGILTTLSPDLEDNF